MPSLKEQLTGADKRREIIEDAQGVLDAEVSDKTGLSGMAIKGAYKVVKGIKPGFIREVIDSLLDGFLEALDPIYQEAIAEGRPAGAHLKANRERVADALLGITDRKADRAKNQTIKKLYEKLRPSAKKHVEAAAPRLAQMLERHVATA